MEEIQKNDTFQEPVSDNSAEVPKKDKLKMPLQNSF